MENKDEKSKIFYLKVRDLDSFQQKIEFCLFWINLDLKVDIEGHELEALPEWMESGALEKVLQFKIGLMPSIFKVGQLAMELHLSKIHFQKK